MAAAYPTGEERALVLCSHLVSPLGVQELAVTPETYPVPPAYSDGLFVTYSGFVAPPATEDYWSRIDTKYYKLYTDPITVYDFYPDGETIAFTDAGTSWQSPFWHGCADFAQNIQIISPGMVYFFNRLFSMYNMIQSVDVSGPHVTQRIVGFPGEADPTTDAIDDVAGVPQVDWFLPELIFSHEGRLCLTDILNGGYGNFGTTTTIRGKDDIGFWDIRNPETNLPQFLQRPIEENQSGIRVAISINANELFLVKAVGGGAVISGDMEFPTIRRLPGIHSTGDVYAKPTNTPLGVVYAGRGGVFLWSGAESSQLLSEQLDGPFWNPYTGAFADYTPPANRFGFQGGFGFLHPFILCPSFFLYDTRFQSWWLLDDPSDIYPSFFMHGTSQGHIIAVQPEINPDNQNLAQRYDPEQQADTWAWTSQPITPERYRVAEIREVNFQATASPVSPVSTPAPTMTITVAGLDNTVETHTVTLNADERPHTYRMTFAIQTETFIISFDAAGDTYGSTTGPAPTLHSFRVGYELLAQHPNL